MENNNKNIISLDMELLKEPEVRIFSKKETDGQLNYIVSLDSKEESQSNSDRIAILKFTQGNPKEIKQNTLKLLSLISDEKVDRRRVNYIMTQLKSLGDVQFTEEYKQIAETIEESRESQDQDSDIKLEIERKVKLEEIFQTKDELTESVPINYAELDEIMPIVSRIDIDAVSEKVVKKIGKKTQHRIECLDQIQSESDVEQERDSLESFMQYRENSKTNRERIILNYINKIEKLDPPTVVDCLKSMEDESNGEDAKLYSVYLRIQEKRIIKKIQDYIIELKSEQGLADGQIEKFGEILEKQKIEDIHADNLHQIVMTTINNENNELEEYLKEGRKADFELMRYIRTSEGKEKDEILKYLQCRVTSLGQIIKSDNKEFELRNFIETTEFKDSDIQEQNYFLFQVAGIEKKYLLSKYGDILERYQSIEEGENKKSLSDYDKQLTELEMKKEQSKELYEQYSSTYIGKNNEKEK